MEWICAPTVKHSNVDGDADDDCDDVNDQGDDGDI